MSPDPVDVEDGEVIPDGAPLDFDPSAQLADSEANS